MGVRLPPPPNRGNNHDTYEKSLTYNSHVRNMQTFDLYVDEHGTISSDSDDHIYGYGFFLVERGASTQRLEQRFFSAFPNGFHLKKIPRNRKMQEASRLIQLLPRAGHFYGGGHIQLDPGYARKKVFNILSGTTSDSEQPSSSMMDAIAKLTPGSEGIVDPNKLVPNVKKGGRMLATYSHVLRIPLISLMRAVSSTDIEVQVYLGVVGSRKSHEDILSRISSPLASNLNESIKRFYKKGAIPCEPARISVGLTESATALFDFSDLFAGVALHYYRFHKDPTYTLGKDLYRAAKPILDRLPWSPNRRSLAHGITVH